MKPGWFRPNLAIALGATLCLFASSSLLAVTPVKILPYADHWEPAFMTSCAPYGHDFEIWSGGTGYGVGKWFPTKGGGRLYLHLTTDDVFINATTRKTVVGHASYRQSIDFATEEPKIEFSGLFWHVVVPGVGNVLHDAGRMTIDLETGQIEFMKGTYQWNVGDFEELCQALK